MGVLRVKGSPDGASYYHVMSRTTGGEMLFGDHEKNVFAKQLRKHAGFAGIEVLTWCMMDNHFHLLIRIPAKDEFLEGLMIKGREGFWKHLRFLYSRRRIKAVRDVVDKLEKQGGQEQQVEEIFERFTRRMVDLSKFLQGLKFAFSVWFNAQHSRKGTLWMERFKSVLLEGEPQVLHKVAAYIDLNSIRAGLVQDPGNYRWSGYGQALGGRVDARRGLSAVYGYRRNEWRHISRDYRQLLYLEGVELRDVEGNITRAGIKETDFYAEFSRKGREGRAKRLARRVRYFSHGGAIGSREFLDSLFETNREKFGPRRQSGARRFRGSLWKGSGMFSLRDLRE